MTKEIWFILSYQSTVIRTQDKKGKETGKDWEGTLDDPQITNICPPRPNTRSTESLACASSSNMIIIYRPTLRHAWIHAQCEFAITKVSHWMLVEVGIGKKNHNH